MSLYKDASLVMIPSAYKDGKLYSIRPTDGSGDFTFSRGSNLAATRVDVNGLIEKGRENLLLQSNQFDNATWSKSSVSVTYGQTGYDGSSDAWLLSKSTSGGRINQAITSSGVQTLSFYAKANTLNWLRFITIGGTTMNTFFDLQNGAIGNTNAIDTQIQSVGNGWYRCSIALSQSITEIRIYPADGNNDTSGTSGSIYIQDAQLEQGLVATDYIETTTTSVSAGILEDMPRLDYSGSCPSLLLEPQRTNLLTHSEYFGGWNVVSQGTGSAPSLSIGGDFPLGDGKYYNLQCDLNGGTTSSDRSYITLGGLSGTQFTAAKSLWIKNNSASEVSLFAGINFSADEFTLAANADWQRITIEGGVINSEFRIGLGGGASNSDSIDVSIFGAQCEAGSYPTSYIPTYGTSQTRSDDDMNEQISGLTSLEQGTFFIEFDRGLTTATTRDGSSDGFFYRATSSFPSANAIEIASEPNGNVRLAIRTPVVFLGSVYQNNTLSRYKMLVKWNGSEVKAFVNGSETYSSPTKWGEMTSPLEYIGYNPDFRKSVNQLLTFPTALTDSECIALTS